MNEEEKWKDIDQLMYRELSPDRYCYIHNYIIDLKSQLQQKENIIKEVREYLNEDKNCIPKHIKDYFNNLLENKEDNK